RDAPERHLDRLEIFGAGGLVSRRPGRTPMPAAARRPTLTAVAERAGVSIATASKVLNRHDVAPATRERVEAALAELGYRAPGARHVDARRTVEFLVDRLDSPYAM